MTIVTIDFEASCLPRHGRSFPIEVGIAAAGRVQSWLIRPHESWAAWDWTAEAEALHGITLDKARREGLPVEAVLDRLVAAMDGRRAVADSVVDQYWLDTLARAAGEGAPFLIEHVSVLLDEQRVGERRIQEAVALADACYPVRHRAGPDAAWLATMVDHATRKGQVLPGWSLMAQRRTHAVGISNNL